MLNWGMTLGIEELNLSGNPLNTVSASKVVNLISSMRKHTKLKRLSMAGMGVDVGQLVLELSFVVSTFSLLASFFG